MVKLDEVLTPVKITAKVPESLLKDARMFYCLRTHNGKVTNAAEGKGDSHTWETSEFSTYMLAFKDTESSSPENADDVKDEAKDDKTNSDVVKDNEKNTVTNKDATANKDTATNKGTTTTEDNTTKTTARSGATSSSVSTTPKTGDSLRPMAIVLIMAVFAAGAMVTAAAVRRRRDG